MRVCVYHRTMGAELTRVITAACPDVRVDVVADTAADPPDPAGIDVMIANTFPPGLLGRCPRLRWLHLTGTGTEHVAAGEPASDLLVTTSARVPARPVAEFAWMALLALAKDAPRLVDQHRRHEWRLPEARLVHGTRLVLVGLGRIGSEIARIADGFGVTVTAVTRRALPSPLVAEVVPPSRLADAAAHADHLVIAAPHTPDTEGLVDARVLAALPADAAVVNVGRAAVLDTAALVAALRAGRLRGAVLDVHDTEPVPPDSPLWSVPNLWLTPHGAYRHPEEERTVGRVFVENLTAYRAGLPLPDRVTVAAPTGVM